MDPLGPFHMKRKIMKRMFLILAAVTGISIHAMDTSARNGDSDLHHSSLNKCFYRVNRESAALGLGNSIIVGAATLAGGATFFACPGAMLLACYGGNLTSNVLQYVRRTNLQIKGE